MNLICVLEALVSLAVACLVLFIIWWAITSLMAAFNVGIPAGALVILKVILVLVLLIIILSALTSGTCGYFGWSGGPHFRR
jgi:hypothetical protein